MVVACFSVEYVQRALIYVHWLHQREKKLIACRCWQQAILVVAVFHPDALNQAACKVCGNCLPRVASLVSWASMVAKLSGSNLLRNNIASSGAAVAVTLATSKASYWKSKSFLNSPIDAPGFCLSCANLFFICTISSGPKLLPYILVRWVSRMIVNKILGSWKKFGA